MKLTETDHTVTTCDCSLSVTHNVHGGTIRYWCAIITTTERDTYHAGSPGKQCRLDHIAALAALGLGECDDQTESITRGRKTTIELVPRESEVRK